MYPISPGMDNTRSNVKRIVVTSSVAAILQSGRFDKVYTEEDWNETSVKNINVSGRKAANSDKYLASKTLAEKGMLCRSASFMHADLKK
jgi:nucleoside-diphosphate-sugar epimerase